MPCPSEAVFKWLVKADIDGLAEGDAAARDVLHLHPYFLDLLDDGSHHVTACVDDEPLLALLEDLAEQGFVDHRQLDRWARMGGHLLALKELVLGIHFPNLLLLPPRKIQRSHAKLACDGPERHPAPTQTLCSSQEAIIPVHGVADTDLSTLASRLDDMTHREWKL